MALARGVPAGRLDGRSGRCAGGGWGAGEGLVTPGRPHHDLDEEGLWRTGLPVESVRAPGRPQQCFPAHILGRFRLPLCQGKKQRVEGVT